MKPNSILILGTSDEMINRIVERLELPEPEVAADVQKEAVSYGND